MGSDKHVETALIPGMRLGRRPHDPDRPTLSLSRLLTGDIPPHPPTADHFAKLGGVWGMLGNDQYSDCGPCTEVHDRMLISQYLGDRPYTGSLVDALDLYRRSGNPNFPTDDHGVVMADMLAECQRGGVAGVRAVAYAQVNVADLDEVRAAIAIFGSLHLGVDLQNAQQAQTRAGGPWDLSNSADWGGHAVLAGLYTSETTAGRPDLSVITWGAPMGVTDAFWAAQTREAWVVIWPEHLSSRSFMVGIDQGALAHDYATLTGRVLPVAPPPPAPSPAGSITAEQARANQSLAALARPYTKAYHIGDNAKMAAELGHWLQAWRLSGQA